MAPQPAFPPYQPILDQYSVGSQLGRGCFAKVFKAVRNCDGVPVAIKVIEKKRLDNQVSNLLHNELRILQAVSEHPGIVTLLDNLETETHVFFIMEYVAGGPLLHRIVSRGSFSENDARILLRTLLLTLRFLADLGCVHRDIKPENILVDNHNKKWPVKLTDFGFSEKIQPDQLLHDAIGTPLFVAPEILKGEGYDCACDMWSLGVVMYLVLCGYPPFPIYDDPQKLTRAIINGDYSFPAREWTHVSADAKSVITEMLQVNPQKRLTPAEALARPWILMAQSTTDLPNSKLKSFNARRKLKAGFMAVRTTFGLRNILGSASLRTDAVDQQALQREVERSRALIARASREDELFAVSDEGQNPANALFRESSARMTCRHSLIFPTGITDLSQTNDTDIDKPKGRYEEGALQSTHILTSDSDALQSKALAMVAEVNEDVDLEDTTLFLTDSLEGESPPKPGRTLLNLEQLDFGRLEIQ